MAQALLNNLNIGSTQAENFLADKRIDVKGFEKVFSGKIGECVNHFKKETKTIAQELNETVQEVIEEGALDLGLIDEVEETQESQIGEELMNSDTTTTLTTIEQSLSQVIFADNLTQNSCNNLDETPLEFDSFELNSEITETPENLEILSSKPDDTAEPKTLKDLVDKEMLEELNIESVEAETASYQDGAESDLMNNQSPQEQGLKAILHTESDVKPEFKTTEISQTKPTTNTAEPSKILNQITKQLENLQNNSRLNIVLNPESLGKVSLQIINTKDGLSAQFTVTSQEAREVIAKELDTLRNSLASQGVNVNNVTVKLNESQSSGYNADWTEQEGSRGGNKEQKGSNKNSKEQEHFEQTMFTAQNNEENGNV